MGEKQANAILNQAAGMRFAPLLEAGQGAATRVRVNIYDDSLRMVDPQFRCRAAGNSRTTNDRIAQLCKRQPMLP